MYHYPSPQIFLVCSQIRIFQIQYLFRNMIQDEIELWFTAAQSRAYPRCALYCIALQFRVKWWPALHWCYCRADKFPDIFISPPQTTQNTKDDISSVSTIHIFSKYLLIFRDILVVSPLCSFLVAAQLVIMDRGRGGEEASTWISFIFPQFTFSSHYSFSNIFALSICWSWGAWSNDRL